MSFLGLVVIATGYGSTAEDGTSYTEKEYDYAVEQKIPATGFILDDSAGWPPNRSDSSVADRKQRLDAFKDKLRERLISQWKSAEDLSGKVVVALTKLMTERPRPGWVRGTEVPTADVLNEMSRLSKENAALREQLAARDDESEIDSKIQALWRRSITVPLIEGDPVKVDLMLFFNSVGWQMTMPRTAREIADMAPSLVRKGISNEDYAHKWLGELSILELVESTLHEIYTLGHPTPQTVMNWTLTNLGKRVLSRLRTAESSS